MYSQDMLASIKKVEATRAQRLGVEPRRMTAEEKDELLRRFHPDYRTDGFQEIKVGPTKARRRQRAGAYAAFQQPSSEGAGRSLEA